MLNVRHSMWWSLALLSLVVTVGACSCESSEDPDPNACADGVTGCGEPCTETQQNCGAGLHCGVANTCVAECSATEPCSTFGESCNPEGRCIEGCGQVRVGTSNVVPTVLLLVDQSGSMSENFGGVTRWNAVKSALLGTEGLLPEFQSRVRFGLTLYSAEAPGGSNTVSGTCPRLTTVAPAVNNESNIRATFQPAAVMDETPTGDSLRAVLPDLLAVPSTDPKAIIIATDGEPDSCATPNPVNQMQGDAARAYAVSGAAQAFAAGVSVYIINVGSGTISATHLQAMANAGVGHQPGDPDAPYWEADDLAGLQDALAGIVGGKLSCTVTLQGSIVTESACAGTVSLNGRKLVCNDDNGFRAVDSRHIELKGTACQEFMQPNSNLEATFTCEGVIG